MPAPVLQFKRGNAGVAGTVPALRPGEPAISLNNFDFFVGIDTTVANNKFFGSHRYWGREDGTTSLRLKLVDKDGTKSINIKSPDTISGAGGTYTLPDTSTITDGYFLRVSSNGTLSWSSVTEGASINNANLTGVTTISTANITNLSVSGVSTFTGAVNANGNVTLGDAAGDTITVNGTATFGQAITGTISTATRSTLVDTTTAASGTYYPALLSSSTGATSATVNVDAGISYVSNTDTLTVQNLTVPGTLTGTATTATRATVVDTTTAATGTYYPALLSSSTGTTSAVVNVDAGISYVSNTDTLTVQNLTVPGTLTGTATTATKLNTNNGSATSGYIPFVTNGTATNGETFYVDTAIQYNGSTDSLIVNNAQHSTVKALDGTSALTISNTTGAVTAANDLTVSGNLYVNGSTTQVNTNSLTVEDRTIELGLVGAATTLTSTWDLAVLFNYGDAGTAKKSAVVWEHVNKRFQFGAALSTLGTDTNGSDVSTPQIDIGATNFAPIEIKELWINDTCVSNTATRVIGCTAGSLILENVTIDAGTF